MRGLFVFLTFFVSLEAFSTSCWPPYAIYQSESRLEGIYEFTDFMIVGKAELVELSTIQTEGFESVNNVRAVFKVEEQIKSNLTDKVRIQGWFSHGCVCAYKFEPGKSYLVFGSRDEDNNILKFCNFIKEVTESDLIEIREFVANKKRGEKEDSEEPSIR